MTNNAETEENVVGTGSATTKPQSRSLSLFDIPSVKVVLIGILTLTLLVPTMFVWMLVEERADRAEGVARDIAASWGRAQAVNGPYLVVPFSETFETGSGEKRKTVVNRRTVVLFPERLDVSGEIGVEERRKSIYSLPVYNGKLALSGRFGKADERLFKAQNGGVIEVHQNDAMLVLGISDVRALRGETALKLKGGRTVAFEPGLGLLAAGPQRHLNALGNGGINAPVDNRAWREGFSFEVPLQLNGSRSVFVAPAGQTTRLALTSDWPHPGFTGTFLPETRTISDTGFEAQWTIPYLARGIPNVIEIGHLPLQDKLMGVKFVEPVNFYQTISRSLKYAVGFVSLTFLAVFVLEVRSNWKFHWVQYALVGFALIVFYVMLLAFAEHLGYGPAYLIAGGAATVLNAVYVGTTLKSRLAGFVIFCVLSSIFAVLFALMREQDYALLIGSVIAFAALGFTMFATQNIDWSRRKASADDAVTGQRDRTA